MGQIIYKGQVYGKEKINLMATLVDPTELELDQYPSRTVNEETGEVEYQESSKFSIVESTEEESGETTINIKLPTSLVIQNGVVVNENAKNNIWNSSTTVTDVVTDQGYRYEYGVGGNRFIWNGCRVLMGKCNKLSSNDENGTPYHWQESYDFENEKESFLKIDRSHSFTTNSHSYDLGNLANGIDIEDEQAIWNFITPDDLYSHTDFCFNPTSGYVIQTGDYKVMDIKIYNKTDTWMTIYLNAQYASKVGKKIGPYFVIPSDVDTFGFFFVSQQWNDSKTTLSLGLAAFKGNKLKAFLQILYLMCSMIGELIINLLLHSLQIAITMRKNYILMQNLLMKFL